MLIPGSNDCRLVLDDDSADLVQLSRAEPMVKRQSDRRQPELRVLTIATDVHVRRFIAVEAIEEEPIRARNVRNARVTMVPFGSPIVTGCVQLPNRRTLLAALPLRIADS